jgi:hypothetical protein
VVNQTLHRFNSEKSTVCQFRRGLGGSQSPFGPFADEKKALGPAWIPTTIPAYREVVTSAKLAVPERIQLVENSSSSIIS